MMRTILVVTSLVAIVCAVEESRYDAPPTIIFPSELEEPEKLVIRGNAFRFNQLTCTASNADNATWVYLETPTGEQKPLPQEIKQRELSQDPKTLDITVSISDQFVFGRNPKKLNGYYKCIVRNRRQYEVQTPPIRLIVPDISNKNNLKFPPRLEGTGTKHMAHRLPCLRSDLVTLTPPDLLQWRMVSFSWGIKKVGEPVVKIKPDSRIKINPITGDLFFAHLTTSDNLGHGDNSAEYQCLVAIGDTPAETLGGRYQLVVDDSGVQQPELTLSYPRTADSKKVTCIESNACWLACIFSGRDRQLKDPPTPSWTQPGGQNNVIVTRKDISVNFTAIGDAQGTWTCEAPAVRSKGKIDVEIKLFPRILPEEMVDQFVEVGTTVEFVCDALHAQLIKFYVNGQEAVADGANGVKPPHVELGVVSKSIKIADVERSHSGIISCVAFNTAGTKFKAAQLNVYRKPNITLEPEGGYLFTKNNTLTSSEMMFECFATLDPKVIKASIHWMSNHSDIKDLQLRNGNKHKIGVEKITSSFYRDNSISSRLLFRLDTTTRNTILGAKWWCVVEMTFDGRDTPITAESVAEPFGSVEVFKRRPVVTAAGFADWWVIGLIVALCFFALIIVLIICCVRHHKGEEYYVDEKERKAGHNPEEELGLYGFSDYKRPDQDPIKGSRTSLDVSDKPMDSDSEGMDEYGDIDPGRFNEDGSFIGQYGKSSNNMDV